MDMWKRDEERLNFIYIYRYYIIYRAPDIIQKDKEKITDKK